MKKLRKILALVLCLVMLFSLSACSLFDTKLIKAMKAMAELESFHTDISASGVVSANLDSSGGDGKALDVDFAAEAEGDFILSPFAFRLDGAVTENSLLPSGLLPVVTVYGEASDGRLNVYYGANDNFKGYSIGAAEGSFDSKSLLKLLGTGSKLFKEVGTEQINGVSALRYDGVFTEETLSALLKLAGADESIVINGDIPVSVWIDSESYHIVRLDVDLSGICESLTALAGNLAEINVGSYTLSFGFGFKNLKLTLDFSSFNAVESINVPEVIASAKG